MTAMNEKDYYAILGVEKDASSDEIRRAFQQKARKLHPDVNKDPGAEERFKEVSEAYAVLSDDSKRSRYDAMRSGSPFAPWEGAGASTARSGGDPFGWGFPFGGVGWAAGRSAGRAYNPRAGSDVVVELDLDERSAREGCTRGVTYQRYASCDSCHGFGSIRHEHAETCPTCGGSGHIGVDLSGIFGFGTLEMECPECAGTGKVVADPCPACGGSGRTLSASEVVVYVPAGSHDGSEVRVAGMGNAGTNGREGGDFVCRVAVASERLSPRQARGFYLLGFGTPFVAFGLASQDLTSMGVFVVILMGVGLWSLLGEGVMHPRTWWKHGLRIAANGASNGLLLALLLAMMHSCASLGTRGYVGR
ncbi:DnaJ domain-containing protein [Olsenella sp. HMSC062G07]|uniref:DnaJ domain-containing protein n=1 Tax=Olsenella sp. HMSC062G07 TaxID=1739330 RepID=UPI0008A21A32|nr:DnaJ domain-containing protein [Olsenella sp. HMSC062G07]OFK24642.1 molecular chaperone DnaJ [Olsenella sp. HMSC062G07]